MSTELIFLILTGIFVSFVALVVAVSHRITTSVKLLFALTCGSLTLWQANIYVADSVTTNLTLWNNLVFVWPTIATLSAFFFILSIGHKMGELSLENAINKSKIASTAMLAAASLQMIAIASGQIFTDVAIDGSDYIFQRGIAYPLYIALLIFELIYIGYYLIKNFHLSKKASSERHALKSVLVTVMTVAVYSVITNIAIPVIFDSQQYIGLGILAVDIFAVGFAYSIIRYKFLDIRIYAFRTGVYLMVVALAAAAYALAASTIVTRILHLDLTGVALFALSSLTVLIAVSFRPLSAFFNRVTSRLFFRDYYEPQDVVDRLSTLLVGTVDLDEIMRGSAAIISDTIKPTSLKYLLHYFPDDQQRELLEHLSKSRQNVIVTDDFDFAEHESLRKLLRKNEIAIAMRLKTRHEDLGFIVMGPRRSGAMYSTGDRRLLRTLADSMALGLQNALRFEEIETFSDTLQQKVNDATRQLRRSNDKLRQLDETKDDFISMASHQLRTPLTSIKGYISMVIDGDAGKISPLQQRLLGQAFISSQRMVYLISDLLNVSRLRTGKFIVEPTVCNLATMVQEEVKQLVETAKGRNLELTYHKPDHFPDLMLDETKMRQVIMNFIDNAIYYTPAGGKIAVELKNGPRMVEFTVTDNGIGVPKTEQHHLFSKFYRAGNAKRARPDGTGLGLFMARKVVLAQGGATIFHSQEGKGSTFGFTFSKAVIAPDDEAPTIALGKPDVLRK
jgi:signal transduction histidine kinase